MKHRNYSKRPLILAVVLLAVIVAGLFVASKNESVKNSYDTDTRLAQYSDKEHVVITNVASETSKEYGSWVWTPVRDITPKYRTTILNTAKANGINVLYLTLDDYIDIYNLPEGKNKEDQKKEYASAIEAFIVAAEEKGIAVDAEAGWRDWAENEHIWKANIIVDFVIGYNATHINKFRGFQYDVEPYLLPTYTTDENKRLLLEHFVRLVDTTTQRLQGSDLYFSVVIPHFYDSAQAWTPSFEYNGVTTFAFNHVLRILNTRPHSSIIIMAYRNTALGNDGAIALAETEIAQASVPRSTTVIIVAQETGDVSPAYVTYFKTSKAKYIKETSVITQTLSKYKNYGGIAVHYIDPFMTLR